ITDFVMATEQLAPPYNESVHHACRLKMNCEAANGTVEDLLEQAAYGEASNPGQPARPRSEEASWEPALNLYEDVPVLLRKWVLSHEHGDGVEAMRQALELTLGHPL
ncbi:hypothetical protein DYB32_008508, partial [Aphanomyces invadans]